MDYLDMKRDAEEAYQELLLAKKQSKSEQKELKRLTTNLSDTEQAQSILQDTAQTIQNHAHQKIAEIVSSCLEGVFDEPYKFHIKFERRRGKTEAVLLFERQTALVDPLTASGGGVVDIAGFALRLASVLLSRPQRRRLIVLDEPFKFVDREHREKIADLLASLAKRLQIQFVMVTHFPELRCGKIFSLDNHQTKD